MLKFQDKMMDEDLSINDPLHTSSISQIEAEQLEKSERAKMAAKRRAQILAQMQNAQKNFMTSNAELFENNIDDDKAAGCSSMDWQEMTEKKGEQACVGLSRKIQRFEDARYRCILCSEESSVTKNDECMVYAAFVQKSSVLSRYQQTDDHGQLKYLETSIHPSPHVTTCGHVMHASCFEKYFSNEMIKENRRPYRNRTPVLFDIEKREFLCPLCRFLSNALLPLLPALGTFNESNSAIKVLPDAITFQNWNVMMEEFSTALRNANNNQMEAQQDSDESEEQANLALRVYEEMILPKLSATFGINVNNDDCNIKSLVSESIEEYINKFCTAVHDVAPFPSTSRNFEEYLVTWLSCAYTIESLEMLLRATDKPLSGELSIRYVFL